MKPGRNDPCPCGSGKKYKHCCQAKESGGARQANAGQLMQAAPVSSPSAAEIEHLAALFNHGCYAEVETVARAMTASFPQHGFGWKALAMALLQQGRPAEACDPLQKATILLPQDAEAHNILGALLQKQGRISEAEASARRALEIKPDFAEAHYNLGIILSEQGRLSEAEASFRQTLSIMPDVAEAHNELGNTLYNQGRFSETEASFRQALLLRPDYAEAHFNLGVMLHDQGRLPEAKTMYRRALEIKPDYVDAHFNLSITLKNQGILYEAEASCRRALELKPDHAEAYSNLGDIFSYMGNHGQAAVSWRKALSIDPGGTGLDAAVWLALLCWLEGNYEQFHRMLLVSEPIMATTGDKHKSTRIYREYLGRLQSCHQQTGVGADQQKDMKTLYVVGESHSLSAHGVAIRYREREMRCSAQWIAGCKQWHLGNGKASKYKHKFEAIMEKIPRQSIILLSIGEIDCRPAEGIIHAWKNAPEKPLEGFAYSTANGYVSYVKRMASRQGHRLVIGGVPTPNMKLLNTLEADAAGQLVKLIRDFNGILKNLARAAGMDFLDVYSLTDRGDGIADGQWHIDNYHLLPIAMTEAFDSYCVKGGE